VTSSYSVGLVDVGGDETGFTRTTTGHLREEWDPRISPALKTAYTYDSGGHVTTLTPPGELPWTMAYDTAGLGKPVSVSLATLTPGGAASTDGTATATVALFHITDLPVA